MGFGFEVWPDQFLNLAILISASGIAILAMLRQVRIWKVPSPQKPVTASPQRKDSDDLQIDGLRTPVVNLAFNYLNAKIQDFRVWHISKGDQMDVHRTFVTLRKWLPHQMEIDFLMTDHEAARFVNNYDMGHTVNQLIRIKQFDPATEKVNFNRAFDLVICQYPLGSLPEAKRLSTLGRILKVLCAGGYIYFSDPKAVAHPDLLGLEPMPGGFFKKAKHHAEKAGALASDQARKE